METDFSGGALIFDFEIQFDLYLSILKQQTIPTALAVSILDLKKAVDAESEIGTHWCLVHFLLDGHHKIYAAAQARRAITLLSFLAVDKGVSGLDDIEHLLKVLPR